MLETKAKKKYWKKPEKKPTTTKIYMGTIGIRVDQKQWRPQDNGMTYLTYVLWDVA